MCREEDDDVFEKESQPSSNANDQLSDPQKSSDGKDVQTNDHIDQNDQQTNDPADGEESLPHMAIEDLCIDDIPEDAEERVNRIVEAVNERVDRIVTAVNDSISANNEDITTDNSTTDKITSESLAAGEYVKTITVCSCRVLYSICYCGGMGEKCTCHA